MSTMQTIAKWTEKKCLKKFIVILMIASINNN